MIVVGSTLVFSMLSGMCQFFGCVCLVDLPRQNNWNQTAAFVDYASTKTPLSSTHYRQLYRHIYPTSYVHTCKCGNDVRRVAKTQKFPDPKFYLLKHWEFNGTIDVDDKNCLSCYKSHLVLVNQVSS